MRCHLQISSYRIDLMSVNGPISPKQCYHEIEYSFYSFYWLDSLEIRLDHNSTYYRSLSKNSDVKRRISHCDSQNLQYKTHPEFWPSHRRIFKTSLYYKTRLILETRRYYNRVQNSPGILDKSFTMKTLKLVLRASKIVNFYFKFASRHRKVWNNWYESQCILIFLK